MSERTDKVFAAIDSEWRSTAEIRDKAQLEECRMSAMYHTLNQAVKYRLAEKRIVTVEGGGVRAEWRRSP